MINSFFLKKGFTLVEFLIVTFIIGILFAIISVSLGSFRNSKALQIGEEQILSLLNEGKENTLAAKDSYTYGIHFESDSVTLFRGISYSSSDLANKRIDIDNAIEISNISLIGGGQDVLFQKLTGKTNQNGTILIRLKSDNSKTKTITIETSGVVSSN